MFKQVELSRDNIKTITWVDLEKSFKVGDYLVFRNDKVRWKVDKIHDVSLERSEINRDWHVGGL